SREQVVAPAEPLAVAEATLAAAPEDPRHLKEEMLEDGTLKVLKRRKRKKRDTKRQLIFMGLWLFVVGAISLSVREYVKLDRAPVLEDEKERQKRLELEKASAVQGFIELHIEECRQVMEGYFAAADTAERAQYVREQTRVASRMAVFYQTNLPRRPESVLTLEHRGLKLMGEVPGIETLWRDQEGKYYELVFVREKGRWAIDWEEFVRYSSMPWHQFLGGTAGREGEFRLYLRKRQVVLESDGLVGVQFYPPEDDAAVRQRGESPRVLVRLNSEIGEGLMRLWEREIEEPGVGDSMLWERDPDELQRVRVVLGWVVGEDGEDYMVMKELVAGDWWGDGLEEDIVVGADGEEPAVSEGGEDPPEAEGAAEE
ncbi:MAG: hypothetical protein O3A87_03980, partial [Verrucomicrobia bacterium]|nr:hypothetical protein [Verrucomicrobiota bacterium]